MTKILRPKALKPGDVVAIAALSSGLDTDEQPYFEHGVREIEALGFRVQLSPLVDLERSWWWAAARPAEVVREFNRLLRDPDVRAIWALTGGKFTLSYIDDIDYAAVLADPKPILGFSDIDAVLLAIHSRTGLVTLHADNVTFGMGEWREQNSTVREQLADVYSRLLTRAEPLGKLPVINQWESWRPGRTEGPLLGGLLHRLLRIQATRHALPPDRFDGAILFFEDVGTNTINVWTDLQVLRGAGVFDRIAGVIVGPTETITVAPQGPDNLREIVLDLVAGRDIPVLGNVNLGHVTPNIPLPLGVTAAMDADAPSIELIEAAVT